MALYVDGFLIPLPAKNLATYKKMATLGKKVWMDHGALSYVETVADDLKIPFGMPFDKLLNLKKGETAIFAFITYKSKAHRDRVNKKVMSDPRMHKAMTMAAAFDDKRMTVGGFKAIVHSK